jgi:hypothetical protein
MPDMNKWLMSNDAIDPASRAVDAWNRITLDSVSIVVVREGASLAAQTVRVGPDSTAASLEVKSDAGTTGKVRHVIFGVRDHPDESVLDTSLKRGDRFAYRGAVFQIMQIIEPPGEVQAFAESVT